ncbi:MAG: nitroreductase family deazaflavin-dependent oxidoreductase [Acidimicrobiaceae bacterium]|nr:nitroreductase family deazaflavin-dependent oxidoreductase [Acidimicrobiaceae bacterium]
MPSTYLLTIRGRKTGRPSTTPVTIVQHDGKRWLVAPYGAVSWVRNARADAGGRVLVRRRLVGVNTRSERSRMPAKRPYFLASKDAPVEGFVVFSCFGLAVLEVGTEAMFAFVGPVLAAHDETRFLLQGGPASQPSGPVSIRVGPGW